MNPLIWIRLLAYSERVGFEQQRDHCPRRDVRTDAGRPSTAIDVHAEPDSPPAISDNGDGSGRLHLTFAGTDAAPALMSGDIANDILAVAPINRPAHAFDLAPATLLDGVSPVVVMPGKLPERLGLTGRARMDHAELHAKAVIAAALIANRAVEIPSVPPQGHWSADSAAVRLRDITDYIYQLLGAQAPGGN
jgi:hypothetical protein